MWWISERDTIAEQREAKVTFISITRLRVRSWIYLPAFFWHTQGAIRQARRADGFGQGALLADCCRTFWTMTAWDSEASMRAYMLAGPHRKAMPHLINWCDEASLVHWEQEGDDLPTWEVAHRRLCHEGRASKVRNQPEPVPCRSCFRAAAHGRSSTD